MDCSPKNFALDLNNNKEITSNSYDNRGIRVDSVYVQSS